MLRRFPARFLLLLACSQAVLSAQTNPDPNRFAAEIDAFREWDATHQLPPNAVFFVGSSTIRGWDLPAHFPHQTVINREFGGAHISDILAFWEALIPPNDPEAIVFYCGDNDIAARKSPERVASEFRVFLARVRETLPGSQVLYLPIKPSLKRWHLWPQMQDVNERIRSLADESSDLVYVDVASPMLGSDGLPRRELFRADGLHLSAEGYAQWAATLGPILETAIAQQVRCPSGGL